MEEILKRLDNLEAQMRILVKEILPKMSDTDGKIAETIEIITRQINH